MARIAVEGERSIYYEQYEGRGLPVILIHGWGMSCRVWDTTLVSLQEAGHAVLTLRSAWLRAVRQGLRGELDRGLCRPTSRRSRSTWVCGAPSSTAGRWAARSRLPRPRAPRQRLRRRRAHGRRASPRYTQAPDFPHGGPPGSTAQTVALLRADRANFLWNLTKAVCAVPQSPAVENWLWGMFMQTSPGADAALAGLDTLDQRGMLAALDVPLLSVVGGKDAIVPPEIGRAAAKLAPRGRVAEFENCGHAPFLEDGPRYRAMLLEFLGARRMSATGGMHGVATSTSGSGTTCAIRRRGRFPFETLYAPVPRSDRGSGAPGLRFRVAHRAPLLRRRLHAVAAGGRRRDRRAHAAHAHRHEPDRAAAAQPGAHRGGRGDAVAAHWWPVRSRRRHRLPRARVPRVRTAAQPSQEPDRGGGRDHPACLGRRVASPSPASGSTSATCACRPYPSIRRSSTSAGWSRQRSIAPRGSPTDSCRPVASARMSTWTACARHGRAPGEGVIIAGHWAIISDDPEREAAIIGPHALYQSNQYIEWGAFGPPDSTPRFPDAQTALSQGLYQLWDADAAVEQLGRLLEQYPQIRDVHFWAQLPGEPVCVGSAAYRVHGPARVAAGARASLSRPESQHAMSLTLRNAFGHFATGVTIITMTDPARSSRRHDREQLLVAVARPAARAVEPRAHLGQPPSCSARTRHFAVHVLDSRQTALARHFATKDIDRFGELTTDAGPARSSAAARVSRTLPVRERRLLRRAAITRSSSAGCFASKSTPVIRCCSIGAGSPRVRPVTADPLVPRPRPE